MWAYSIWNDPEMGEYLPDEAMEEIEEDGKRNSGTERSGNAFCTGYL